MKHAYLILAHNEFDILRLLIGAIDDERNDIFVHFDRKVSQIPQIATQKANLFVLSHRVDVRWADVSMLEAEYALFEAARAQGSYAYYHLLSGVDLPLKTQDEIHRFFEENNGKEFIGFYQKAIPAEIERRVQRIHLFPRHFRETRGVANKLRRGARFLFLQTQNILNLKRNNGVKFKKGTQWISVTQAFADHILSQKTEVLAMYRNSFCSDEIFAQTLCWNSPFRNNVFDEKNEGRGCMRHIGWKNNRLDEYTEADLETLRHSEMLFARKFGSSHLSAAQKIAQNL